MSLPTTFTLAHSQRVFLLVIGGFLAVMRLIDGDPVVAAAVAVVFPLVYLAQGKIRTEVNAVGVEVHRALGSSKSIRWDEVTSVEERPILGTRQVKLVGGTRDLRLPAPIDGFLTKDPDFDAKMGVILDGWAEYGPADG